MNIDPEIQQRHDSPGLPTASPIVPPVSHTQSPHQESGNAFEKWNKTPKARGRQPRDPRGQSVRFQCRDVDEMESFLREYLKAPTVPAEHANLEFAYPISSAFMVSVADIKGSKKPVKDGPNPVLPLDTQGKTAISVIDALAPTGDSKIQMRKQKAIAKICVESCEKADGFRYSFHNNWLSREDEACRFSYFCNDSTLNKGRAANEGAGMAGKKMRKPVYDCQGLIAIKFSATKQSLEVHYRHVPLHKTYAERAPPPRRDSKRQKIAEASQGDSEHPDKRRKIIDSAEAPTPKKPRQRRLDGTVSTSLPSALSDQIVEVANEADLQPLTEFLGTVETGDTQDDSIDQSVSHESILEVASRSESVSKPHVPGKQPQFKPRRPAIPGTMAGSVLNGHLNWGSPTGTKSKQTSQSSKRPVPKLPPSLPAAAEVHVIVDTPTTIDTADTTDVADTALTELEIIRRELREAQERIRRLESERAIPPQHVPWPPPPSGLYTPPPPTYPPAQTGDAQVGTHLQPLPQQPLAPTFSDINALTTSPKPGTSTTPTTHQGVKKSTPVRSVGTKFVAYAPRSKSKKTLDVVPSTTTTPN